MRDTEFGIFYPARGGNGAGTSPQPPQHAAGFVGPGRRRQPGDPAGASRGSYVRLYQQVIVCRFSTSHCLPLLNESLSAASQQVIVCRFSTSHCLPLLNKSLLLCPPQSLSAASQQVRGGASLQHGTAHAAAPGQADVTRAGPSPPRPAAPPHAAPSQASAPASPCPATQAPIRPAAANR